MIKNGVKYGIMNGVKGHPLGPSFAVAAGGLHRRSVAAGAPCGIRNCSTAAASPSSARACFPPACPKSHCFPTTFAHQVRWPQQPRRARPPQHISYEPEVASTDLVKLDKASQLVPADVQQALLKAYEEAAAEED